jgi:hypothetical protein
MCLSRLGLCGPRPSALVLGALMTFPVGRARRKYLAAGSAGAVAGGGAVDIAGRPGREIGGRGRCVASPTNRRTSLTSAAWRSANVAAGPMQRNHSAAERIGIDIGEISATGHEALDHVRVERAIAASRRSSSRCAAVR